MSKKRKIEFQKQLTPEDIDRIIDEVEEEEEEEEEYEEEELEEESEETNQFINEIDDVLPEMGKQQETTQEPSEEESDKFSFYNIRPKPKNTQPKQEVTEQEPEETEEPSVSQPIKPNFKRPTTPPTPPVTPKVQQANYEEDEDLDEELDDWEDNSPFKAEEEQEEEQEEDKPITNDIFARSASKRQSPLELEEEDDEDDDYGEIEEDYYDNIVTRSSKKKDNRASRSYDDEPEEQLEEIEDFAKSFSKKREDFWSGKKQSAMEDLEKIRPKERKKKSEEEKQERPEVFQEKTTKPKKDIISFKKETGKSVSTHNIPPGMRILFEKLKYIGFSKEIGKILLENVEEEDLLKFTALFSIIEFTKYNRDTLNRFLGTLRNVAQYGTNSLGILQYFLSDAPVFLSRLKTERLQQRFKINAMNFGLTNMRYIHNIYLEEIKQFIQKTRKQYKFDAVLASEKKVSGLLIPLEKLPKKDSYLTIYSKLGFCKIENDEVYSFVAKDEEQNNSIIFMQ